MPLGRVRLERLRKELLKLYPELTGDKSPAPQPYLANSSDPLNPVIDPRKTLAMRLVESHFGQPLETLLSLDKRGVDVAKRLGIRPCTVTRWRQRLGLSTPVKWAGEGE